MNLIMHVIYMSNYLHNISTQPLFFIVMVKERDKNSCTK